MNNDTAQSHEKNVNAPVIKKRIVVFGKDGVIEGMLIEKLRQIGHDVIVENVNHEAWFDHQIKEADAIYSDPTLIGHVTVQLLADKHKKPVLKLGGLDDLVDVMLRRLEKLDLNKEHNSVGEFTGSTPVAKVYPSKKIDDSIEKHMQENAKPLFDMEPAPGEGEVTVPVEPLSTGTDIKNESDTTTPGL